MHKHATPIVSSTPLSRLLKGFAALLLGVAIAGCSSVKLDETKAPIEDRNAGTTAPAGGTGGADARPQGERIPTITAQPPENKDPLADPSSPLSKRSIYFDYDSFVVKDEYKAILEAHARYLSTNRTRKIVIQGNTDERGGREYNLALGQKRAEAVRKSLSVLGVPEAQLEAVSFGKEKPRATTSDEAGWAENRRADLAYQ